MKLSLDHFIPQKSGSINSLLADTCSIVKKTRQSKGSLQCSQEPAFVILAAMKHLSSTNQCHFNYELC